MTPLISTRLAAASPRPANASPAASRSAPENSFGPSLEGPAALGAAPPGFLDSNPSDPMTPDPTRHLSACYLLRQRRNTRPSMIIHDDATRILRIKITLWPAPHSQKTFL